MNTMTAPILSFDVNEADFESAVLQRSLDVPVLLDCWAPWCGPCKSLKPVLEKLALAYEGRFVLAKLNTDEAPEVAAALQLRSIPQVMLFIGGQPVDQFSGALPEGQVRQFLDRHLPEPQGDPTLGIVGDPEAKAPRPDGGRGRRGGGAEQLQQTRHPDTVRMHRDAVVIGHQAWRRRGRHAGQHGAVVVDGQRRQQIDAA